MKMLIKCYLPECVCKLFNCFFCESVGEFIKHFGIVAKIIKLGSYPNTLKYSDLKAYDYPNPGLGHIL